MRPAEIQVKINLARREMEYWQGVLKNKSCKECEHGQRSGWCSKHEASPPQEVQLSGCDDWCWCEIPF
jgi:hypothetical protein